jgi:hypothetical protein
MLLDVGPTKQAPNRIVAMQVQENPISISDGQWTRLLCVSHRGVSAHIPVGARATLYELRYANEVIGCAKV